MWKLRLNFDVACNMDFHMYPVDIQTCFVKFESFDLHTSQVVEWHKLTSMTVSIFYAQNKFWLKISFPADLQSFTIEGKKSKMHKCVKYSTFGPKIGWWSYT